MHFTMISRDIICFIVGNSHSPSNKELKIVFIYMKWKLLEAYNCIQNLKDNEFLKIQVPHAKLPNFLGFLIKNQDFFYCN